MMGSLVEPLVIQCFIMCYSCFGIESLVLMMREKEPPYLRVCKIWDVGHVSGLGITLEYHRRRKLGTSAGVSQLRLAVHHVIFCAW